ncbi:MAG: hypothetical protein PHI49_04130 [Halothiobacillaceae bacterium]|jgi:uncharacterized membrane protein YgcG|nr:hypothetical protein [Halothiobacillaceae bacterium]MDY0049173.1 hypothetical protein [Halothiobacillaceae bacterium]
MTHMLIPLTLAGVLSMIPFGIVQAQMPIPPGTTLASNAPTAQDVQRLNEQMNARRGQGQGEGRRYGHPGQGAQGSAQGGQGKGSGAGRGRNGTH